MHTVILIVVECMSFACMYVSKAFLFFLCAESLFPANLVDHSFAVRNSHGAIVSLQLKRLSGHAGPITTLAITATHLFSGSRDKSILVWDLASHALLSRLDGGHIGEISALVVSPDADMLYSACDAGVIASWDLCIMCESASVQPCHEHPITALALSAGRLFSADDRGVLKAWDACMMGTPDHSELEWPSKQAHTYTITALTATDIRLFSAGMYVKVWDSRTLTMVSKIKMHSGLTTALCVHGDRLFTGSRAIKVWDLHSLQRTPTPSLKKHAQPVTAIAVSWNSKRLYSASHVIKVLVFGD
jgi:WD40 repeat protein